MFACQLAEASRDLMDEIIALHPKDHSCGCSTGFHAELMCDKVQAAQPVVTVAVRLGVDVWLLAMFYSRQSENCNLFVVQQP